MPSPKSIVLLISWLLTTVGSAWGSVEFNASAERVNPLDLLSFNSSWFEISHKADGLYTQYLFSALDAICSPNAEYVLSLYN